MSHGFPPFHRADRSSRWARRCGAAVALVCVSAGLALANVATAGSASAHVDRRGPRTTLTTAATEAPVAASTTVPAAAPSTTATSAPPSTTPTSVAASTTATSVAPSVVATTTRRVTTTTAPSTTTTIAGPVSGGAAGSVLWGAATPDLASLTTFDRDAGKRASLYLYYDSFVDSPNFDASQATSIRNLGATPLLTWEPWDPSTGSTDQPAFSLASIAGGAHDSYLSTWAAGIKAWGQPLWLRFAHEMNGNWYPWGDGVNGNTPAQYVAAYRHVHDLFARAGVTNVTWVWTPNVTAPGWTPISQFYPGDAYVNWVGVDGYNWGTTQTWGSTWQTPSEVLGETLANLRQLTSRPIVIGETASAEQGGNKAQWINQFFSLMAATPAIKAFVWFNYNKETDWRIESSSAARAAFAAGVASSRYVSG